MDEEVAAISATVENILVNLQDATDRAALVLKALEAHRPVIEDEDDKQ